MSTNYENLHEHISLVKIIKDILFEIHIHLISNIKIKGNMLYF
jgi:hypothetical protein